MAGACGTGLRAYASIPLSLQRWQGLDPASVPVAGQNLLGEFGPEADRLRVGAAGRFNFGAKELLRS
jgi:hypothetical protein